MTMMSASERAALLKLIARTARVAAADVDSLAAERYAEFERQASKEWEAQELGVNELIDDANAQLAPALAQAQQLVTARCDELGIAEELRPKVHGGAGVFRARLSNERKAELRRLAKAEIESARKRAKVEIERSRSKAEAQVLSSAIESDEGLAILGQLPTADALLPPVDTRAILCGGGESRRD